MRIQARLALLLAAVAAGFALATWSLSYSNAREVRLLKENLLCEHEDRLDNLLSLTGLPLKLFIQDYTNWDEMVAFVGTGDAAWAKANIRDSLDTLKIDAAWVLRPDLSPVFAANRLSQDSLNALPIPVDELKATLAADRFPRFFVETAAGLLEVRGAPIQPSADTTRSTPLRGWMLAARLWDDAVLASLTRLTNSQVSLTTARAEPRPTGDAALWLKASRPFNDWRGRTLRILHAQSSPEALVLVDRHGRVEIWLVMLFGGCIIVLLAVGASWWVARPLRALQSSMARRDAAPLVGLRDSASEFGELARLVESSFAQQATLQREVEERGRMAGALHESERRFRAMFENSQVGMYRTTPDGRVLAANPAVIAMLGYRSLDELTSLNLERDGFEPSYSRREFKERIERDGEVRGLESEWRRRDGTKLFVRENARAVRDAAGIIECYEGTVEDITERKRIEESQRQLFTLMDEVDDAVIINDVASLRILYVNQGAAKMLGYAREELLQMTPADIDLEATPEDMQAANAEFAQGNRTALLLHTRYRRKDGRHILVDVRIQYHSSPDGPAVCLAVARDVTERKAAEQQQLRAQRLESIGTLAGGVAHDLNNLFTPLMMFVDELRQSRAKPDGELIDMVETSIKRGSAMVRQLLTFGRGIEGERLLLQPHHLLKDIAKFISSTFPKSITLRMHFDPGSWPVHGDVTQLHQVILNLCVNARDAMPEGGTLSLAARNLALEAAARPEWSSFKPGRYVLLEVADTGMGIAPEIMDRIFEPFFTTKANDKGTGLGLSTALGIVRSHGGTIRVESEIGRGSCFRVLLPAVSGEPSPVRALPIEAYNGGNRLVLVVDDEQAIRRATTMLLAKMGFRVVEAGNGRAALALCARQGREIQLIISDVHMPEMNGVEFVRSLRAAGSSAHVIAMSGRFDERLKADLAALNVTNCLEKPFSRHKLIAALQVAPA